MSINIKLHIRKKKKEATAVTKFFKQTVPVIFHTELKSFSFCDSLYFIEQTVPVILAHIFAN